MKKIGIVTLFGYNNYGNRLQMFAVQKVFKNLGFDSEILRYKLRSHKDPVIIRLKVFIYNLLHLKSKSNIFYLKTRRILNFKNHAKQHYQESGDYLDPLNIDAEFHENYSFFSVGSDQIWGWFIHRIGGFVFLKFAPGEKRITFSPSFGSAEIDQKYKEIFSEGLMGFNYISVREESGAQIVKNFIGNDASVTCDPTMCLTKKEWLHFSHVHTKKPSGKYILTYFLGEPAAKVQNILNNLSEEFIIVNLNSFKSRKYYAITPSEWVDYINDAELFLTDSFHGVVFSIVLQTPFAVYSRVGGENMQTRITNILDKFNFEERFEMYLSDELLTMNFTDTPEIINKEKEKVLAFLKISLGI